MKYISLFTIFISLSACGGPDYPKVNSELICPDKFRTLVKFVRAKDLKEGINAAYLKKKETNSKETYTVIKLKDGRSLVFRTIPPEIAIQCVVQESYIGFADKTYVH